MEQNEKMGHFHELILQKAQKKHDAILSEVAKYREAELEKIKDDVLKSFYNKIQLDVSNINQEATMMVSQKSLELKKQLLSKRAGYEQEIFDLVRERLELFSNGKTYSDYLKSSIKELPKELCKGNVVVRVRERDKQIMETLLSTVALVAVVQADSGIEIGGFVLHNVTANYLEDRTLDNILEEQRTWFHHNSGLVVDANLSV